MIKDNKAPAISIITKAYNAEKYIEECAESVLNQNFKDFEWIVVDNGSTDATGMILEQYAKKDGRIRFFRNEKNTLIYNVPNSPQYDEYLKNINSEYWCVLDSDDYLHTDFLKELYTVARIHDADIAVGGTEMFLEKKPQYTGMRCPPDFFTRDITDLADMLPEIYGCFRPIWGKLFKLSVVVKQREYRAQNPLKLLNGTDTIFCIDCLSFSSSVVGVNKVLHYYRMRETSHYHSQVHKYRYMDYKLIYNESKKLLENWNKLNDTTSNFIAIILYDSIKDCIDIAANAVSIPRMERLEVLDTILSDEFVNEVFSKNGLMNNLFIDMQNSTKLILEGLTENELPITTTHYLYRLYKSIEMGTNAESNRQNAFLLYLSSICDEKNNNRYGAVLLDQFFGLVQKDKLKILQDYNIKKELLASDTILLREIVNGNWDNVIEICKKNSHIESYDLLKQKLSSISEQVDLVWLEKANHLIGKYIDSEYFEEAIELLLKVLEYSPLNKEALCYKLYLLIINGDLLTALETAEVLDIFYADDSETLVLAAQAFTYGGLKDRARKAFEKALAICMDDVKRIEIEKELEAI